MDELWSGYFREESDIVFHLARFCSEEFGVGYVHLDSPISTFYFSNYPSLKEKEKRIKRQFIDITDPNTFSKKDAKHGIFVEVKWIYKDIVKAGGKRPLEIRMNGIEKDLERLEENLKNGRCENAFMTIIDDEGRIDNKRVTEWKEKYPDVQILLCQCKM